MNLIIKTTIMATYRSCKHCGNEQDGDTIYQCDNGHIFCESCSVLKQNDILGTSCPTCKERGSWKAYIKSDADEDDDDE